MYTEKIRLIKIREMDVLLTDLNCELIKIKGWRITAVQRDAFIDAIKRIYKKDDWIYGFKLAVRSGDQMKYNECIIEIEDFKGVAPDDHILKQKDQILAFF